MVVPVKVEISGDTPYLSVRATRRVMKGAYEVIGKKWLEDYLPMHFHPIAPQRYGFTPRTAGTQKKKRRLAERGIVQDGGRLALVWSGVLRRAMLNHNHRVDAYPTRATIKLIGPSYLSINYKPGRPNMGREILTVIPDEAQKLNEAGARRMEHLINQELKQPSPRRTIKG